jgi:T5SS/PEP-CTERM-associated repeat protein
MLRVRSCQYIRRGDYRADYPAIQGDDPQTVLMRGGCVIVTMVLLPRIGCGRTRTCPGRRRDRRCERTRTGNRRFMSSNLPIHSVHVLAAVLALSTFEIGPAQAPIFIIDGVSPTVLPPLGNNTGSDLVVDNTTKGALPIQSGGTLTNAFGFIGNNSGSPGTVTDTRAGSNWTSTGDVLFVGNSGTATLTIQNAGAVRDTEGRIATRQTANGTVMASGAGSAWIKSGALFVRNSATGTLIKH